ncbi:uncharacterized protein G2W53_031292 [Senna tora]|uniref:Uncharacterized protein n=1 Tax=Senna tora TaxID=362788 RepID=A0A834WDT5_9FABA|nr:uncharacterized protein G2W53_031292 [Senna tora]
MREHHCYFASAQQRRICSTVSFVPQAPNEPHVLMKVSTCLGAKCSLFISLSVSTVHNYNPVLRLAAPHRIILTYPLLVSRLSP